MTIRGSINNYDEVIKKENGKLNTVLFIYVTIKEWISFKHQKKLQKKRKKKHD